MYAFLPLVLSAVCGAVALSNSQPQRRRIFLGLSAFFFLVFGVTFNTRLQLTTPESILYEEEQLPSPTKSSPIIVEETQEEEDVEETLPSPDDPPPIEHSPSSTTQESPSSQSPPSTIDVVISEDDGELMLPSSFLSLAPTDKSTTYFAKQADFALQLWNRYQTTDERTKKWRGISKLMETLVFPFVNQSMILDTAVEYFTKLSYSGPQRGYVILMGGHHFRMGNHLVQMIRKIWKSNLPIEIFYLGDSDLPLPQRQYLESIDDQIKVRDLTQLPIWDENFTSLKDAGWSAKPYGVLASSFAEPILMDADTVLLQNPEVIYEEKSYLDTGIMLWHDRVTDTGTKTQNYLRELLKERKISETLGGTKYWTEKQGEHFAESGLVVYNKRRPETLFGLMFVLWMNGKEQRDHTRDFLYGEKETFWLGFELLGFKWHIQPEVGGAMGKLQSGGTHSGMQLKDVGILHFNSSGQPLWFNGGMYVLKSYPRGGLKVDQGWSEKDAWAYHHQGTWGAPRWLIDYDIYQNHRDEVKKDERLAQLIQDSVKVIIQSERDMYKSFPKAAESWKGEFSK
ncbi:hypothetical protein PROFUN_05152 [Planoprotostelium fungivorum]|uniref:Uncharacterized protein n=1 Tax=Planoprotostelium fungivorum TaxID=1890364 RepID=A0A2P6NRS2_9EUKA|nr:hypothetical protein PROFUN_05152 [Planoprotostelium fungivorum]